MRRGRDDDHAVVLGASMAGLLAATVLAEHHRHVTVVDRDSPAAGVPGPRRGVPQGAHIHALLARGQQALEELLPGLTRELVDRGAPVGDMLADSRWYLGGRRLRPAASGLTALSVSRPLLEDAVLARVRATSGVEVVPRCEVLGPVMSGGGRRVVGVRVRRTGGTEQFLPASLVVDATGRGSRTPRWFAAAGLPAPEEERLRIGLGYATRTYRARPATMAGDLAVIVAPAPPAGRGGVIGVMEGDRWMVTLMGVLGDHPPIDPAGFDRFAASLPVPDVHEATAGAEPLDDPVPFRFPASVRRRYERLTRFPQNLLVVGDAFCSFNPVYGQGMTVAALEALELRRRLRNGRTLRPQAFHRAVARIVDVPWDMARGGDLAFPGVVAHRTPKDRLLGAYLGRLQAAAATDAHLAVAFARVAGLVDRPEGLLSPQVVRRVLRA